MRKILSIILIGTLIFALSGCGKAKVTVIDNSESEISSQSQSENEEAAETKSATVNLSQEIKNTEYCDMEYTLTIPNWEFEKDRGVLDEGSKIKNYTRMYKSSDPNFKFFVTEYFGINPYPGRIDEQFGQSLHTQARAVSGCIVDDVIYDLTGYSENGEILNKEPIEGENGEKYYEFCLQLPNEYDNYYYVKGYVAVGIKRPIAVYFFDRTKETLYDDDMINKSLEIIKTLKVDKKYIRSMPYDGDDLVLDIEY